MADFTNLDSALASLSQTVEEYKGAVFTDEQKAAALAAAEAAKAESAANKNQADSAAEVALTELVAAAEEVGLTLVPDTPVVE
jgi:hypothetical protein